MQGLDHRSPSWSTRSRLVHAGPRNTAQKVIINGYDGLFLDDDPGHTGLHFVLCSTSFGLSTGLSNENWVKIHRLLMINCLWWQTLPAIDEAVGERCVFLFIVWTSYTPADCVCRCRSTGLTRLMVVVLTVCDCSIEKPPAPRSAPAPATPAPRGAGVLGRS